MLYSRYEIGKDGKRVRKSEKAIADLEAPKGENSSSNRKSRTEQKEATKKEAPKKEKKGKK